MARIVDIHTLNVLVERAIWEASHKHPELALIRHYDEHFDLCALEHAYAERSDTEVAEAFDDLTGKLMLILARLLGKEMAQRLLEEPGDRPAQQN